MKLQNMSDSSGNYLAYIPIWTLIGPKLPPMISVISIFTIGLASETEVVDARVTATGMWKSFKANVDNPCKSS